MTDIDSSISPAIPSSKACSTCKTVKALSEFTLAKNCSHGVSGRCRACSVEHKKTYRAKDKEKWRAYDVWISMIARCNNSNHIHHKHYGGRGIKVCDRWLNSLEDFRADMGQRPEGCQIDRTNNDGNYEPSNCRWVTVFENAQNKRTRRNSITGITGVLLRKDGFYQATIGRNGIRREKTFKQRWDAVCWRKSMENTFCP